MKNNTTSSTHKTQTQVVWCQDVFLFCFVLWAKGGERTKTEGFTLHYFRMDGFFFLEEKINEIKSK